MTTPQRLLFITLSNIGDLVMTTPLLRALHEAYPDHLIDVVADARSSELLSPCPYLGRLMHKDKRAGVSASWSFLRTLREHRYTAVIDLRTPFLSFLLRSERRGTKQPASACGSHAIEHHFSALRSILDSHTKIPNPRLWLDNTTQSEALQLLRAHPSERILAIAPGANWPGKIWPVERYVELIAHLESDFDHVLVLGAAEDRARGESIRKAVTAPLTNLAGSTTLLQAAACIVRSSAFVGNDSGLGHMAAALEIPTITVFGPGQPERYRPWGRYVSVVMAPDLQLPALDGGTVARSLQNLLRRRTQK